MIRRFKYALVIMAVFLVPRLAAQESYAPLVDANTKFAFHLFQQMTANAPSKNILVAPTAISLDFALLANGATGDAKTELLGVFELQDFTDQQINQQSKLLLESVSSPNIPTREPGERQTRRDQLLLARSLWTMPGVVFRPSFAQTAKQYYRVTNPKSLPADKKVATNIVNAWIAQHTGGQLRNALSSVRRDGFFLVNTTWFNGYWINPFDPKLTYSGDFTLSSGAKTPVLMMSQSRRFLYLRGPEFQAVSLPYWNARMLIFLPEEKSSLAEFEKLLTSGNWTQWVQEIRPHEGYLELPKFNAGYKGDSAEVLKQLGMRSMFSSNRAFAKGIANPEGGRLTRVIQVMSLKVDERGTEIVSAGINAGVVGGISSASDPPFRMIVSRPFFFAIVDNKTDAILYMGAVVNPK